MWTVLHSAACEFGSGVVLAGPGMIYCVCDFSTLCPRKEGVKGGLGCGHREHIVPGASAVVHARLLSLELTLLHRQKKAIPISVFLAIIEP